jgi:hypothetical protein
MALQYQPNRTASRSLADTRLPRRGFGEVWDRHPASDDLGEPVQVYGSIEGPQ